MDILEQIRLCGLIPIVRTERCEDALTVAGVLSKATLPIIAFCMDTDDDCDTVTRIRQELPDVLAGAYGALDAARTKRAIDAGATFIVTTELNPDAVRHCAERGIPIFPGCANPSDIETAIALGLTAAHVYPMGTMNDVSMIEALAAPLGGVHFVVGGNVCRQNLNACLSMPVVLACMSDWIAPSDVICDKAWSRVAELASGAVQDMLGFSLAHVGINSGSEDAAFEQAEEFCAILGWPVRPGNSSVFAGKIVEFVKEPWTGAHGHIAIGVSDIHRAWWHMEKYGVVFDWENAKYKGDDLVALYLKQEIGGFAVHLLQR